MEKIHNLFTSIFSFTFLKKRFKLLQVLPQSFADSIQKLLPLVVILSQQAFELIKLNLTLTYK
jgi:hypothetical protein